jgi:hypothetical protein
MPALETQAQIRAKLDAVYAELDRMYRSPHVGSESPEYAAFARKRAALEAEQSNLADKLARAIEIGSDHPDNLPWIVRITPEMRAKLLKEGLPAMMVPLGAVVGGTRKQ